ncbi:hypothetical protein B0J15DRAFT_505578 [Fusarium solani]|uniref:Secreted protein n=1 Tax=Fusarium solani TaxID=169388 RepID=A0A9P9G4X4_FUSSL|nr:uncharacterized protein B0J15DRAFT_505578 [Fusarium solani]KAH7232097.1 hypothetical protein B0J15DRAFT_505578 [Fusarium solani]
MFLKLFLLSVLVYPRVFGFFYREPLQSHICSSQPYSNRHYLPDPIQDSILPVLLPFLFPFRLLFRSDQAFLAPRSRGPLTCYNKQPLLRQPL